MLIYIKPTIRTVENLAGENLPTLMLGMRFAENIPHKHLAFIYVYPYAYILRAKLHTQNSKTLSKFSLAESSCYIYSIYPARSIYLHTYSLHFIWASFGRFQPIACHYTGQYNCVGKLTVRQITCMQA